MKQSCKLIKDVTIIIMIPALTRKDAIICTNVNNVDSSNVQDYTHHLANLVAYLPIGMRYKQLAHKTLESVCAQKFDTLTMSMHSQHFTCMVFQR